MGHLLNGVVRLWTCGMLESGYDEVCFPSRSRGYRHADLGASARAGQRGEEAKIGIDCL